MAQKYTNIYYFYYLSDIGGTETFLYELSKKYHKLDLTIVYRYANENQIKRLQKYVRCVQFREQEIECERAFFNYGMDIIEKVHAKDYYFVIHADYEDQMKRGQLYKIPDHPKINHYIAVSSHAAKAFTKITGKKCEVCYNPYTPEKNKEILHLVSATRLSKEKGKNRMVKFAEMLDKAGIKYIWTIFTNDKNEIDNPNIAYMTPRLDVLDYVADADYLVQLSDNESFCYSVVEALCAGTPVIVTPCPVFEEIGLVEGKNCYYIPFDMKDVNVKKILDKPTKFNYRPPQDSWSKFLIDKPNTWLEEKDTVYLVEATDAYQENHINDGELHRTPAKGERWEVTPERMRVLTGENERNIKFVKVVGKYYKNTI